MRDILREIVIFIIGITPASFDYWRDEHLHDVLGIALSVGAVIGIASLIVYSIYRLTWLVINFRRYLKIEKRFNESARQNAVADKAIFDNLFVEPLSLTSKFRDAAQKVAAPFITHYDHEVATAAKEIISIFDESKTQMAAAFKKADSHLWQHTKTLIDDLKEIITDCINDTDCSVTLLVPGGREEPNGKTPIAFFVCDSSHIMRHVIKWQYIEDIPGVQNIGAKGDTFGKSKKGQFAEAGGMWVLGVGVYVPDVAESGNDGLIAYICIQSGKKSVVNDRCVHYAEEFFCRITAILYRLMGVGEERTDFSSLKDSLVRKTKRSQ